jgi:hypothetical protein
MTPFHLDFARNRIHHADPAGMAMDWARIPADTRYLLLQYSGYATRTPADFQKWVNDKRSAERRMGVRGLAFYQEVRTRSQRAKILYDDGVYLLLRTEAAAEPSLAPERL